MQFYHLYNGAKLYPGEGGYFYSVRPLEEVRLLKAGPEDEISLNNRVVFCDLTDSRFISMAERMNYDTDNNAVYLHKGDSEKLLAPSLEVFLERVLDHPDSYYFE